MKPPAELERLCKGLATLDAIVCEDWESRYYSFNRAWAPDQRMASMRNGCGDEWFIAFAPAGTFMKAFWHEHKNEGPTKIYKDLPPALVPFLEEPAFSTADVTYGGWHDGTTWTLRGNAKAVAEELARLTGAPEHYRAYAAEYFEQPLPLDAIAHVLAGKPLDAKLLKQLGSERTLADLRTDLDEIGY